MIIKLLLFCLLVTIVSAQTKDQAYRYLKVWEGYNNKPIHRNNGEIVVGIGHALKGQIKNFYSDAEITNFFYCDYFCMLAACRVYLPGFDNYPLNVRLVTLSVAWTCGRRGLMKFRAMKYALQCHAWELAAFELSNSRRAHQISTNRALTEYNMLADIK